VNFIKVIIFLVGFLSVFHVNALGIQEKKLFENVKSGILRNVRQALDRGADFNAIDECGWTALHYAAYFGHLNVVIELLDMKCNSRIKTPQGKTAYDLAKEQQHTSIMIELFARSAVDSICPF
jgi:hypothetical protein